MNKVRTGYNALKYRLDQKYPDVVPASYCDAIRKELDNMIRDPDISADQLEFTMLVLAIRVTHLQVDATDEECLEFFSTPGLENGKKKIGLTYFIRASLGEDWVFIEGVERETDDEMVKSFLETVEEHGRALLDGTWTDERWQTNFRVWIGMLRSTRHILQRESRGNIVCTGMNVTEALR